MITTATLDQIDWFRHAAPYINQLRNKRMVVRIDCRLLEGQALERIVHDITLLHALGLQLVICFGARLRVQAALDQANVETELLDNNKRITCKKAMTIIKREVGLMRFDLEAELSRGLANTPMHHASLEVVSGNLITARPVGVVNGIDLQHTGMIRRVDADSITNHLNQGRLVLLPPLGYSLTGEAYNLWSDDVAEAAATHLQADKLIFLDAIPSPAFNDGQPIRELSPETFKTMDTERLLPSDLDRLRRAAHACDNGIKRVHILNGEDNGALIKELFTRDGEGCMLTHERYQNTRSATIDDVKGIVDLISPLEQAGTLVKRPRELLENEINNFMVIEKDGSIIACAALYQWPDAYSAEWACVAVHPDYRRQGLGDKLLEAALEKANQLGLQALFVLTTQSEHWFQERQFQRSDVEELPTEKQKVYNLQRASLVLKRSLTD